MVKNKKTRAIIAAVLIALAVAFGIIGMVVLPETLTTQLSVDGQSNSTMPKPFGLLVPFAVCAIFSVMFYKGGEKKNFYLSLLGFALYIFTFVINLNVL